MVVDHVLGFFKKKTPEQLHWTKWEKSGRGAVFSLHCSIRLFRFVAFNSLLDVFNRGSLLDHLQNYVGGWTAPRIFKGTNEEDFDFNGLSTSSVPAPFLYQNTLFGSCS